MYEVVATLAAVVEWVKGENRNVNQWNSQLGKLKKAFHYFMMELEVDEFKDLKLPSEKKPKSKGKQRREKGTKSVAEKLKRAKEGGKQLQLFFVKNAKKLLLNAIVFTEDITEWCSKKLFGKVEDYENRRRR
jgi:hypothetical protein